MKPSDPWLPMLFKVSSTGPIPVVRDLVSTLAKKSQICGASGRFPACHAQ